MRKFSRILAILLTVCILCGLIVTTVFADTDPAYVHPTLTNTSAVNIAKLNFEDQNAGATYTGVKGQLATSRFMNSSLKIGSSTVNGVSNKFWTLTLPEDTTNNFLTGSNGTNQRSSYVQFLPNSSYAKPAYYLGTYDSNTSDGVTPIQNNFDYLTIDFDISAQGARVDWSDGTYGRAVAVTKGDDGSISVTLTDGAVVVTSADKTETTITAQDGTVTLWVTDGDTVTKTVTAQDGSKVVSVTVVLQDGSATKTTTAYDAEGEILSNSVMTRSAVVNGCYTVTYDSGKTLAYSYAYEVNNSSTGENTTTETYTVTENGVVTVYTFIDHKSKTSNYTQTLTYRKSVDDVVESENVSTFEYKSSSGKHTNNAYIKTFNAEFAALGEEFPEADAVGKHVAGTRTGYTEFSMYNTFRWYGEEGGSILASTNNFYYLSYVNGSWGIFHDSKSEANRIVTLPEEIGVWNHITILVEADNNDWRKNTKVHFIYNGELLDTYKLSEKSNASAKFIGIEDWRMTTNDILPGGNKNFFSVGIDNLAINAYTPTVTTGEDGVAVRTSYTSGDAFGIDDFCQNPGESSLAKCTDAVYNKDYMIANDGHHAIVGGEKYYVSAIAAEAIAAGVKNGETVVTAMDLNIDKIPEGVGYFNIQCGKNVVCTVNGSALNIQKTATGYKVYRTYIYANDYIYYDGSNNSGGSSGTGSAGNYSTLKSVTYNGNAYTQYAYKATPPSARYRYDFALGAYIKGDFVSGYQASDYDYFTVDFDIFADKYVYLDGDGNQVLADTVPEGVSEYKLAYADGMNIALDMRNIATATSTEHGSGHFPHTVQFRYDDGDWHLYNNSADTGYVLSRNLYEVNHFTYAAKITHKEGSVSITTNLYFNGELIATKTNSAYNYTIRAIDWYNTNSNDATNLSYKYSVGMDNLTVNYYSKGYTSGEEMLGVDDLFVDGASAYSVDYQGIVYNAEYPLDPSVNGYVQIGDGEKIYNPVLAKRAIEAAADGASITATRAIYNVTPNGAFTFTTANGAPITVVDEALETYFFYNSVKDGVTRYVLRLPNENDVITLVWVDAFGSVIATETLEVNKIADPTGKNASRYDIEKGTVTKAVGWCWDLDGKGGDYAEALISSFTPLDADKIGGTEVKVYPKTEDVEIPENAAYIAYVDDNGIIRLGYEDISAFADSSTLPDAFKNCCDGTVIKLVMADDSMVIAKNTRYDFAGKSVTFDLNGKTITAYNTEAYGDALIRIGEGATAIVTSSVPGARVFLLSKRASSAEGHNNNRIFSTGGIVKTNIGVDSASVEISNIEFNGGTMFKADGHLSENIVPEYSNDVSINVTVDNVVVNAPQRSSYAVFATLAPDVVINITNSKFYVPDATYSMFHDYADDSKNGNYYESETDVYMSGCEVICFSEGATPKIGKLWYTMGVDSSMYIEDSKIIANMYNNINTGAKFTFGPGVEIATSSHAFLNHSEFTEGTLYKSNTDPSAYKLALSFTRSGVTTNWSNADEANGKYIDSCYTDRVLIERSAVISFASYTADEYPESIGKVIWNDNNGNNIGTDYEFVGLAPTPIADIKDFGLVETVSDWYTKGYVWVNAAGGNKVLAGVNTFEPGESYTVKIVGMQQNATLFTDMTYNLYVPVSADVSGVSVVGASLAENTVEFGGVTYYVVSATPEIEDFAAVEATIKFTAADGKELEYKVSLDVVSYADAVVKHYGHATKESTLVYEMMNYKQAAAELLDSSFEAPENLLAFKASHKDCDCGVGEVVISDEEKAVDYSALIKKGVTGVSYIVTLDEMGMVISVGEGVTVTSVTYTDALGRVITHSVEAGNLIAKNGYYLVIGVSAAYIDNIMTITAGGASGTYCLGKYIVNQPGVEIAKAIYKYSVAAERYKNTVI